MAGLPPHCLSFNNLISCFLCNVHFGSWSLIDIDLAQPQKLLQAEWDLSKILLGWSVDWSATILRIKLGWRSYWLRLKSMGSRKQTLLTWISRPVQLTNCHARTWVGGTASWTSPIHSHFSPPASTRKAPRFPPPKKKGVMNPYLEAPPWFAELWRGYFGEALRA